MTTDTLHQPSRPASSAAGPGGAELARHLCAQLAAQPGLSLPGATFASVKGSANDLLGHTVATMWINASPVAAAGASDDLAAVRLDAVLPLLQVTGLDERTVALALQQAALRPDLPAPPLAALLLASVQSSAVVFTQPASVIAAGATADPVAALMSLFGSDVLFLAESSNVAQLAARTAALVSANPSARGILIGRRGLLTWGADIDSVIRNTVAFSQSSHHFPPAHRRYR